jgi:hypothetical protein
MANTFSKTVRRTDAQKANVSALQWIAMIIVILVVMFSDVMFIKLMWNHFPDGFMRVLAVGGAIATGLSIITLLIGKLIWFRPGAQMNWAYAFMAIEIIVSILNVLSACGVQGMDSWMMISPATPFVCLIGWTFVLVKDNSTKRRHEDMDMEDEMIKAERDFIKMQHDSRMEINYKALEYNKQYMIESLENPQHQRSIQLGAERLTANAIQQLTGRYAPPAQQIASPHVVDADPVRQPVVRQEQMIAASKDQVVDPGQVKPEVDAEKQKPKSIGSVFGGMHAAMHNAIDKALDKPQSLPVEQPQVAEEKPVDNLKLPSDPGKWSHKHWMIARDNLPWNEYKKLFDEYRGDEPEKEYIVKPITEERPGHDPRTRRLGGDEEFEDQEDNENPQ